MKTTTLNHIKAFYHNYALPKKKFQRGGFAAYLKEYIEQNAYVFSGLKVKSKNKTYFYK
jgi:hypothetical protein